MNSFQDTQSGQGLLKADYGESDIAKALRARRRKLEERVMVPTKEEVEGVEREPS